VNTGVEAEAPKCLELTTKFVFEMFDIGIPDPCCIDSFKEIGSTKTVPSGK
jgi:hypothetical protein